MDIISRLPGCDGQAADAVSAETQEKWKMLTNYWKFQNRSVQTFVYHDTNGLNHGPVWKTQSFLLKGISMVILWQDYYGKGALRRSYWSTVGRRFQLGMSLCTSWKGFFLSVYVDDIKIGWKETKSWSDVEITQQRSRFGRTNILPGSCILGMHSTTMPNKQRYCGQLQSHVWIANFSGWNRKNSHSLKICVFLCGHMTWKGMRRNVWSDIVSWQTGRLNNSTKYLLHVLRPPIQGRRNGICWRNVRSMLTNRSEMLKLGTNWKTWYSMVSEQICTINHKMDQGLWQTPESIDFIHSSHMWLQTTLSCGKHCQTMQTGTVSRLRFAGDLEYSKSTSGGTLCVFWKSYICSDKLDV